jgi:hypothetical protein
MDLEGNLTTRSRGPVSTAPGVVGFFVSSVAVRSPVEHDLPQSFAILRDLSRSPAIAANGFQIPYKLLFTHFMERSASVANIKCG